jgi:hypothetical protein
MGVGEFEDYFPQSASGEMAGEEPAYFGRNVIWIGDEGRMVRASPDYTQHIWGNIFDEDKLAAVVSGIKEAEGRTYFVAPYGTISKIDLNSVRESMSYWEDEGLDRPYTTGDDDLDAYVKDPEQALQDETYAEPGDKEWEEAKAEFEEQLQDAVDSDDGDLGEWVVTVRDGNHRTFGSFLAGEPYTWVMLSDNQYQDLMHAKKKGTLTEDQKELLEMLH